MLDRTLFAAVAVAVAVTTGAAADGPTTRQCPADDLAAIVHLLRQAPSCHRAVELFEICAFGSSGDVGLGAAVTEKCEAEFLSRLSTAQHRSYDAKQKRCARKYQNEVGTMYRSFEVFCGVYVARDYAAGFRR